jgi:hypothetical protein
VYALVRDNLSLAGLRLQFFPAVNEKRFAVPFFFCIAMLLFLCISKAFGQGSSYLQPAEAVIALSASGTALLTGHILQCVADAAVNELLHSEGLHSDITCFQR